jgi:hypothetical protein
LEVLMEIKIKWTSDEYDCETCGWAYAQGAVVTMNGTEILNLEPVAHCFGGDHWDRADVYREILLKLGYTIVEEDQDGIEIDLS